MEWSWLKPLSVTGFLRFGFRQTNTLKDFVNNLKPKVIRLVEEHRQKFDHLKAGVELFGRFALPTQEREDVKSFNVRFKLVNANTDLEELVDQFNAILGAKFADFSEKDSGKFF